MGDVDYDKPSCYDNIRTFPLEVKAGRSIFVCVESSDGVDISIVDTKGMNVRFQENIRSKVTIGPVPVDQKGTMALVLGVFAGDRTDVTLSAWME